MAFMFENRDVDQTAANRADRRSGVYSTAALTILEALDMTRNWIFGVGLGALVVGAFGGPAVADHWVTGAVDVGPGETVVVRTARGSDYSTLTIANLGSDSATVGIDGDSYDGSVTVGPGDTAMLTQIFGSRHTRVTNSSAKAAVSVDVKRLSTTSSR